MNRFIMSVVAMLVATATSAFGSDLHHKAPMNPPVVSAVEQTSGVYVGANIGKGDNDRFIGGLLTGIDINSIIGVEVDVNQNRSNRSRFTTDVLVNGVVKHRLDGTLFTPYVFVGTGYRWSSVNVNRAVYNVGAGSRVAITNNVDWDIRYRFTEGYDRNNRQPEHAFTTGFVVKF